MNTPDRAVGDGAGDTGLESGGSPAGELAETSVEGNEYALA